MPNAAIHPSNQDLAAFSQGRLSDAASAAIAQHLETCSACGKIIKSLPPDSFLVKLRAAKPGGSSVLPGPSPSRMSDVTGPPEAASSPASQPPDLPPELANHPKYGIVRELGRGGMGVVYLATHKVMDRPIAIKVINPSVLTHPDALPRFHSEVRTAAKLDHPNIVRALDADQVGSLHLLVMEYVEGKNLDNLVRARGCLPIRNACHYVHQAALGMQHAFEQGMVHRDIKPGNLVLTPRGRVKILDFGLALLRDTGIQTRRLTAMDSFMGTPEYVSPEQASDARNADTRSDIYSLGCTLFYLLAGRPPFQEETVVKLVLAHIEKEAPLLHQLRSEVPPELSAIVAQMLTKSPANRYQTPVAVAQVLMQFAKLGGKPAAGGALLPPQDVKSPAQATFIGADTSKLEVPVLKSPLLSAKNLTGSPVGQGPLKGLEPAPISVVKKVKKRHLASKLAPISWWKNRGVLTGIFILLLALLVLWGGGTVFKLKTPDGAIVLENLPPDADVLVDGTTMRVTSSDGKTFEVRVAPGKKHRLEVKKDGFKVFGEEVEIETNGRKSVLVRLVPVPDVIPIPDQPKDNSTGQIAKAKEEFVAALKKADQDMLASFDREIEAARHAKVTADLRLRLLNLRKEEKAAFETDGTIPWSPHMRPVARDYLQARTAAERPFRRAYDEAIDRAVKAPDENLANELRAEKKTLLQPKLVGTWECTGINFDGAFTWELYSNGKMSLDPEHPDSWDFVQGDKLLLLINQDVAPNGTWHDACIIDTDGKSWTATNQRDGSYQGKLVRRLPRPTPRLDDEKGELTGKDALGKIEKSKVELRYYLQIAGAFGDDGFTVEEVQPGGPATHLSTDKGMTNLEAGDIILEMDGKAVKSPDDYAKVLNGVKDHTKIKLKIRDVRTGNDLSCTVTAKERGSKPTDNKMKEETKSPQAAREKPKSQEFEQLFNGRDLTGWKTRPEWNGDWRVEKHVLIWSGVETSQLWTERGDFSDFCLHAETRVIGRQYAQVIVRDPFDQLRKAHAGYIVVLNNTNEHANKTGSLGVTGGGTVKDISESPVTTEQWFPLEVIARGNRVIVSVNGQTTADYVDPERRFARGRITLFAMNRDRDPQRRIEFRKIEIKELPSKNPKNQAGDGRSAVPQKPPNPVATSNPVKPNAESSVVGTWDGIFNDGNTGIFIFSSDHMIVGDNGFQGHWKQTGRNVVCVQTIKRAGERVGTWEGRIDQPGKTMKLANQGASCKYVRRSATGPAPSVVGTWDATFSDGTTAVFSWTSDHKCVGDNGVQARWDQRGRKVIVIQTFPLAGKEGPGYWEGEIDTTGKTITWTHQKLGITCNYVRR
ncbi:MAG TPA: protein kinase [Gemmataceae bacterium]|nr:protein kinase [Gemmataceae bacterium]